jgi:phosphoribosylformylglycinamidine synthase
MSAVKVLLFRTAGTNCDRELAHAFTLAGANVEALHINTILKDPGVLSAYHVIGFPGGFSYGDDIASGKIFANQLIHHLKAPLRQFVADGKMILGICNGFQILVKSGLLPGPMPQLAESDWHPATLTYNTSGSFIDRWIRMRSVSKVNKWIPAGKILAAPIAHGEGRFVVREPAVLHAIRENDQVAFEYVDSAGERATESPANPNGSTEAIAGICDVTGRVMGLMPHPERISDAVNHPMFSRDPAAAAADGAILFKTAVEYIRSQQAVTV